MSAEKDSCVLLAFEPCNTNMVYGAFNEIALHVVKSPKHTSRLRLLSLALWHTLDFVCVPECQAPETNKLNIHRLRNEFAIFDSGARANKQIYPISNIFQNISVDFG